MCSRACLSVAEGLARPYLILGIGWGAGLAAFRVTREVDGPAMLPGSLTDAPARAALTDACEAACPLFREGIGREDRIAKGCPLVEKRRGRVAVRCQESACA